MRTADMDSRAYAELGQLMTEYPDWKQQFPELCAELNPIRCELTSQRGDAGASICMP